jgi:hypothetical protein
MRFCGEIEYMTRKGPVHSDVCHECGELEKESSPLVDKEFYHKLLDEWLAKSCGTGFFWIGDPEAIRRNFKG